MKTLPKLIRISRLYQGPSLGGSIVVMGVTGSWSGGGGRVKAVQGGWVLPSTDYRLPTKGAQSAGKASLSCNRLSLFMPGKLVYSAARLFCFAYDQYKFRTFMTRSCGQLKFDSTICIVGYLSLFPSLSPVIVSLVDRMIQSSARLLGLSQLISMAIKMLLLNVRSCFGGGTMG